MKQSVKRLVDYLEALGFQSKQHPSLDPAKRIYWHANDPDTPFTVWAGMSDAAASKITKQAEAVIGLATTETDAAEKKAKREANAKKRDAADYERRVKAKEEAAAKKEAAAEQERKRQFALRLKNGNLTTADRLAVLSAISDEWIEPSRIVDELCFPEKFVSDAIGTEGLLAHMHGDRQVRCKVADVRRWVETLSDRVGA